MDISAKINLYSSYPISGYSRPDLVCSNKVLGTFWPVYAGIYINI